MAGTGYVRGAVGNEAEEKGIDITQGLTAKVGSLHFILSTNEKALEGTEQRSDMTYALK